MLSKALNFCRRAKAARLLKGPDEWFGFRIERVRQRRECLLLRVVEETSFLEKERDVRLSSNIVAL